MSWLTLTYFLSIGTLSYTGQTFDTHGSATFTMPSPSFQTTLGVEAQILDNHVFVGGSVETWESPASGRTFFPSESLYVFKAGIRGWGFEIGYRHECDHPVIWGTDLPLQDFSASRDDVYLSFTGQVKVF